MFEEAQMFLSEISMSKPESAFVCACEGWSQSACIEMPFYKEHEGKRYCVLHYPSEEKSVDFKAAYQKKLEAQDFNFRGVWFPDEINFPKAPYTARLDFSKAFFNADANFIEIAFTDVYFLETVFNKRVFFSHTTFNATVLFNDAEFKARADFSLATFKENAPVYFSDATFGDEADFREATFNSLADFGRTKFKLARFDKATFNAPSLFSQAEFAEEAYFSLATFIGEAEFREAEFRGQVYFGKACFKAESKFFLAVFSEKADFEQTSFITADFRQANFIKGANFKRTIFTTAEFRQAVFKGEANFGNSTFSNEAGFSYTTFGAEAFFSFAIFNAQAFFSEVVFGTEVNFSYAFFGNYLSFKRKANQVFNSKLSFDFQHTRIEKPDHISFHSLTLSPYWFVNVDVRKFDFINVGWGDSIHRELAKLIKKIEKQNTEKDIQPLPYRNSKFDLATKAIIKIKDTEKEAHRLLAITCRQIAMNAEENHRYEEASKFRYWAMDLQRKDTSLRWKEGWTQAKKKRVLWRKRLRLSRLFKASGIWVFSAKRWQKRWRTLKFFSISGLYSIYRWVCGYGERISNAILTLILILMCFAFFYTWVGFTQPAPLLPSANTTSTMSEDPIGHPLELSRAFTYSLGVMSLQKPEPRPLTGWAHTLVTLETILGPVQAALLVLAIRRKFMR